jgi:hypothetical protein
MADIVEVQPTNTATHSSVNSGIASVTLLAKDGGRKGAVICNTDANALLVDLTGGTASATRHQYRIVQHGSLEIPYGFTGKVTGVWEGDGTGVASIASLT